MIKYTRFLVVFICIYFAQARLVFPPDTDIGYIIPDELEEHSDGGDNLRMSTFEEKVNKIKRAFWDTALGLNDKRLNNQNLLKQERPIEVIEFENLVGLVTEISDSSVNSSLVPDDLKDDKHGVVMGVPDKNCDDGNTNLQIDISKAFIKENCTCYTPKVRLKSSGLHSIETCMRSIPKNYFPTHYCMDHRIDYHVDIPLAGQHRPIWPMYGKYSCLPPQRWLHNVEHGAVIVLYHPCADPQDISNLMNLVWKYIRKYVMTPYSRVSKDRPFALVTWGCKLELATVDETEIEAFILKRAFKGPEGMTKTEGMYDYLLMERSATDEEDYTTFFNLD